MPGDPYILAGSLTWSCHELFMAFAELDLTSRRTLSHTRKALVESLWPTYLSVLLVLVGADLSHWRAY
jgi:hypothetical protein